MTALHAALRPAALSLGALLLASAAEAHPGHLTDLAGHDHWVAGAAIGLAIALGLYGALKGKSSDAKATTEAEAETTEDAGDEART